jgi:hypothetical protein
MVTTACLEHLEHTVAVLVAAIRVIAETDLEQVDLAALEVVAVVTGQGQITDMQAALERPDKVLLVATELSLVYT